MSAGGLPLGSGDWNNSRVYLRNVKTYSYVNGQSGPLPTDCALLAPQGGVISLEGSFTARDAHPQRLVERREQHVPGDPATSCNERTFIFEGGDLWFDVNDPALPETDPPSTR